MALNKPPCLESGCYKNSTERSYCGQHQPKAFATNFRKKRLPGNWDSLRQRVLFRDNWLCYICNKKGADAVDHVIPNDDNHMDNLKAVHENVEPFCHRKKTANEAFQAKQANQPRVFGESLLERARREGIL
jgi:hypothetical protein